MLYYEHELTTGGVVMKNRKLLIVLGIIGALLVIIATVFAVQQSRGYQEKLICDYITQHWDEKLSNWEELDRKNHEYDSEHYDILSTYDYDISFGNNTIQVYYDAFDELADWQMDDLLPYVSFSISKQKKTVYTEAEVLCNSDIYTIEYTDEERIIKKNGSPLFAINKQEEIEEFNKETQELLEASQKTLDQINSGNNEDSTLSNDEKGHIWTEAKYAVEEQLKSPSTADFPSVNHATITKSGASYTVSSYVDAENSFGAIIRTNFTVTIEKSGDIYTITSVIMD